MAFVGFLGEVAAVAAKHAVLLGSEPPDDAHEPDQCTDALVDGIERCAAAIGPCFLLDDSELLDDILPHPADNRVPEDGAARPREFETGDRGFTAVEEVDPRAILALRPVPLREPVRVEGPPVAKTISETCCYRRHHPILPLQPGEHVNWALRSRNRPFRVTNEAAIPLPVVTSGKHSRGGGLVMNSTCES